MISIGNIINNGCKSETEQSSESSDFINMNEGTDK